MQVHDLAHKAGLRVIAAGCRLLLACRRNSLLGTMYWLQTSWQHQDSRPSHQLYSISGIPYQLLKQLVETPK